MKTYKILLLLFLSFQTLIVFAQNNTIKSEPAHSARSSKELLKMEVMKIKPSANAYERKISKNGIASTLSLKEQMKMSVAKLKPVEQYHTIIINKSGKCKPCLKLSHLSGKEKMKMTVMGLGTCPGKADSSNINGKNCSICNMDVLACN